MDDTRIYNVNEVAANPEHFHGQTVQLAGVLQIEFEGDCISHFPTSERLPNFQSSLWADFDADRFPNPEKDLHRINGRRVTVTAIINKEQRGHFGLWPGGALIQAVTKYEAPSTA